MIVSYKRVCGFIPVIEKDPFNFTKMTFSTSSWDKIKSGNCNVVPTIGVILKLLKGI